MFKKKKRRRKQKRVTNKLLQLSFQQNHLIQDEHITINNIPIYLKQQIRTYTIKCNIIATKL